MSYTVAMILADTDAPAESLPATYMSVDEANAAGAGEIEKRGLRPGAITFKVYDRAGREVDEAGMGLS